MLIHFINSIEANAHDCDDNKLRDELYEQINALEIGYILTVDRKEAESYMAESFKQYQENQNIEYPENWYSAAASFAYVQFGKYKNDGELPIWHNLMREGLDMYESEIEAKRESYYESLND